MINVLLCIDDFNGNYTRHCAVTILSLLETNKNHKIKIFIMSSYLPEENVEELKRIVKSYNQEIEFIIRDDIIPKEIKEVVINRRDLTWGTRYRLFFPLYINNIDRILYMDCDVLVTQDIGDIFNMDMKGKAIAGNYDISTTRYISEKHFGSNNYVNAGVILIDVNKFKKHQLNTAMIAEINNKYGEYIDNADQDYLNIIYKNEILVYGKTMNFLVNGPILFGNNKNVCIYHCLAKPYTKYSLCPPKLIELYFHYLSLTKRKTFLKPKLSLFAWIIKVFLIIGNYIYNIAFGIIKCLFGMSLAVKFNNFSGKVISRLIKKFK